jgi:hypothetical protein
MMKHVLGCINSQQMLLQDMDSITQHQQVRCQQQRPGTTVKHATCFTHFDATSTRCFTGVGLTWQVKKQHILAVLWQHNAFRAVCSLIGCNASFQQCQECKPSYHKHSSTGAYAETTLEERRRRKKID